MRALSSVPKGMIPVVSGSRIGHIVDRESNCWIWVGAVHPVTGYGVYKKDGKTTTPHRFYFERARGAIAPGLQLDHLCRNRRCVNPEHLDPVTCATNIRRGRQAKLTIDQVIEIRRRFDVDGARQTDLAAQFGVSVVTIHEVVHHIKWREAEAS